MIFPKMLSARHAWASGVTRILALVALGLFLIQSLSQAEATPSVTLAWNPSPSPGIMGYRLHYGFTSGSYSVIIDVGNTTTATVQNLTVGQTYYFDGVWFMDGTRIAGIQNFSLPPYAGQICCASDFDNDGRTDLVTFNRSAGQIYFWKNYGSSQFVQQTSYAVSSASGWLPVGITDLSGSSASVAVIWRNANTGEVAAWFMSSFNWSSAAPFGNPGAAVQLCGFGDFSGDRKNDLLLFDTLSYVVGYWRTNGAQVPSSVPLAWVSGSWVPVGAEDLNGSGNADIIWRQASSGALGAWEVDGSAILTAIGSLLVGQSWQLQPQAITP